MIACARCSWTWQYRARIRTSAHPRLLCKLLLANARLLGNYGAPPLALHRDSLLQLITSNAAEAVSETVNEDFRRASGRRAKKLATRRGMSVQLYTLTINT